MFDLKACSALLQKILPEKGISQYACTLVQTEKQELNTENEVFSLFRTTFDSAASVTALTQGRKGKAAGSDLTEQGLAALADAAIAAAMSSESDEANAIAEREEPEVFRNGPWQADMDRFCDRLSELLDTIGRDYPRIKIMALMADHTATHTLKCNSNGTVLENWDGVYHVAVEFAGNDGVHTTGFQFAGVAFHDLDTPLIELGNIARALTDAENSLEPMTVEGKFVGTVILTPGCLAEFAAMLTENYMGGSVIMAGTSQWKDRLGEKVASDKVTLRYAVDDARLAVRDPFTADGYKCRDAVLLDKGVLKGFCLDLYTARKTGRDVLKNDGVTPIFEPGETPLAEMIAGVERGLMVGGFSGGMPGPNGEFSGVAKNSFYIENGRIVNAVAETMISGNLAEMFDRVIAVSRETVCDGASVFPYLACGGVTVSGS